VVVRCLQCNRQTKTFDGGTGEEEMLAGNYLKGGSSSASSSLSGVVITSVPRILARSSLSMCARARIKKTGRANENKRQSRGGLWGGKEGEEESVVFADRSGQIRYRNHATMVGR
jgi:hypothetical protein